MSSMTLALLSFLGILIGCYGIVLVDEACYMENHNDH